MHQTTNVAVTCCPLCGGQSSPSVVMPIDAKSFQPIAHGAIWRCDDCGFGFVSPRPTPTETEEFYRIDKYYTQGQSHLAEVAEPTFQSRLRTHLAWRVDRGEQDLARIAQTALGQQKARI